MSCLGTHLRVGEHRTLGGLCPAAAGAILSSGRPRAAGETALRPTEGDDHEPFVSSTRPDLPCPDCPCLGLAACSTPTAHTPPRSVGPSNSSAAAAVPPAPTAAVPEPNTAVSAPTSRVDSAGSACTAELGWSVNAKNGRAAMSQAALLLDAGRSACLLRPRRIRHHRAAAQRPPRGRGPRRQVRAGRHSRPQRRIRPRDGACRAQGHDQRAHLRHRQPGAPTLAPAPSVGQSLVAPAKITGWSSLTAVTFAGSFEGQTTLAVGVRQMRPFRVWVSNEHGNRHVVLDIAH
jgi:hypothetical protein